MGLKKAIKALKWIRDFCCLNKCDICLMRNVVDGTCALKSQPSTWRYKQSKRNRAIKTVFSKIATIRNYCRETNEQMCSLCPFFAVRQTCLFESSKPIEWTMKNNNSSLKKEEIVSEEQ